MIQPLSQSGFPEPDTHTWRPVYQWRETGHIHRHDIGEDRSGWFYAISFIVENDGKQDVITAKIVVG